MDCENCSLFTLSSTLRSDRLSFGIYDAVPCQHHAQEPSREQLPDEGVHCVCACTHQTAGDSRERQIDSMEETPRGYFFTMPLRASRTASRHQTTSDHQHAHRRHQSHSLVKQPRVDVHRKLLHTLLRQAISTNTRVEEARPCVSAVSLGKEVGTAIPIGKMSTERNSAFKTSGVIRVQHHVRWVRERNSGAMLVNATGVNQIHPPNPEEPVRELREAEGKVVTLLKERASGLCDAPKSVDARRKVPALP